jgi:hypothetical protein
MDLGGLEDVTERSRLKKHLVTYCLATLATTPLAQLASEQPVPIAGIERMWHHLNVVLC